MEVLDYVPIIIMCLSIIGYIEARYRQVHSCLHRVEDKLGEHINYANEKINEMYELKGKLEK